MELALECDSPAVALGERKRTVVLLAPGRAHLHPASAIRSGGSYRLVKVVCDDLSCLGINGLSSAGSAVKKCWISYLFGLWPFFHCPCTRSVAWFQSKPGCMASVVRSAVVGPRECDGENGCAHLGWFHVKIEPQKYWSTCTIST